MRAAPYSSASVVASTSSFVVAATSVLCPRPVHCCSCSRRYGPSAAAVMPLMRLTYVRRCASGYQSSTQRYFTLSHGARSAQRSATRLTSPPPLAAATPGRSPLPSPREELGGGSPGGSGGSGGRGHHHLSDKDPAAVAVEGTDAWLRNSNPRAIVKHLDSYVVGQSRAKKILAVGVYNHYVRVQSNALKEARAEEKRLEDKYRRAEAHEKELQAIALAEAATRQSSGTKRKGGTKKKDRDLVEEGNDEALASTRIPSSNVDDEQIRRLAFGRREREWLDNASGDPSDDAWGSPSASAQRRGDKQSEMQRDTAGKKRGSLTRAAQSLQTQILAEAAARAHDDVLAGYRGHNITTVELDESELNYFSSHHVASERSAPDASDSKAKRSKVSVQLPVLPAHEDQVAGFPVVRAAEAVTSQMATPADPPLSSRFMNPELSRPSTTPFFSKTNVMLIGPTGTGKTLLLQTIADALRVPFVHLDATPFTQAGYVGEDVDTIVHRLLVAAGWDVDSAQRGIVCIDEVDKIARRSGDSSSKDVSGEGVQQALLRILEGTIISVTDKSGTAATTAAASSNADRPSSFGSADRALSPWWQDSLPQPSSSEGPQRKTTSSGLPGYGSGSASAPSASLSSSGQGVTYHVNTSSVLFVLSGAFVGLEKVVAERLGKAVSTDTRDAKPLSPAQNAQPDEELYSQAEPADLTRYGLIPEFVGRIPVVACLQPLSEADMLRVLTEPRNALVSQYVALLEASGIELRITTRALESIAQQAKSRGTGARALRGILEERLLDAMYAAGSSVQYALLDHEAASGKREVLLYSRGGKHAFLAAYEDEEAGVDERGTMKGAGMGVKVGGFPPTSGSGKKKVRLVDGSRAASASGETGSGGDSRSLSESADRGTLATTAAIFTRGNGAQIVKPTRTLADLVRRRARARLTRPSRVGNMRVQLD